MTEPSWAERDGRTVWHPMSGPAADPQRPIIVGGDGAWVTDIDGHRFLDGKSGLWCVNAGYGREELARAAYDQLTALPYYPLTDAHRPAVLLGERLNAWLDDDYVFFFSNSGSEANELAFKIARQYHQHRGEPERWKFLARYRGYHGQTLGALAASGQQERKIGYGPLPAGFLHVAPPDAYRCHLCAGRCTLACAGEFARMMTWEMPETIAGVIVEPVITGGGVIVPPDGYLPAVAEACRTSGALLIVDEAICGFGRVGERFGHQAYGVRPDIVTMAKAVASGYMPLAVTAVRREIYDRFEATGRRRLRHINTFGGHPAACAVALANIDILEREELPRRARDLGAGLAERLAGLAGLLCVGEIRGKGLLFGIELVEDRTTKAPLPPGSAQRVVARCREQGLIVGRTGDAGAGLDNVITIGPPLIVTEDELDLIAAVLYKALTEETDA